MQDSLKNVETPLYRYVKPAMVNRYGYITRTLFQNRPDRDGGLLSVTDGGLKSPQEAFEEFPFNIAGVVCVTVKDCRDLALPVLRTPSSENAAHCSIDVRDVDQDLASLNLYYKAKAHGWLYPEDNPKLWE